MIAKHCSLEFAAEAAEVQVECSGIHHDTASKFHLSSASTI